MRVRFAVLGFFAAVAVAVAAVLPAAAWAQSGGIVRQVVIEGAQRIEPETVRSYMVIQEGDVYDARRADQSLKTLFGTGLFADVSFHFEGDVLSVRVVENPVINRIAFEGNRRIEDKLLEAEVSLRPRVIYTRTKVQDDVTRLLTLYRRRGRFAATVVPKVIQLEQNRVDLVFEIDEGKATEIQNIRFIGNKQFKDGRLKEVIRTRETRWYRFFSSDDNYDPDRVTFDREFLRRFYMNEGFADFRVLSAVAELTPDREAFFITYVIDEGPRYRFGDVGVVSVLRGLEPEQVEGEVGIEGGDWYDADAIDRTVEDMAEAVERMGFPFIEVRPRVSRNREAQTIDVVFEVGEGPRVFVERIDISGNMRTQDSVIRREFRLTEGDAFNAAKLRRSRKRIEGLDFFEKLSIEQVPGSAPDQTVVAVEVEEKSTGSLSLGAGYSTAMGPLVDVGVTERNLLGKGQYLRLGGTMAGKQSQVDLSFTEPFFMDREVAAGFDLFHKTKDYQDIASYDFKSTGGSLRLGYFLTDDLRQNWRYTLKRDEILNVSSDASQLIRDQAGLIWHSEVAHSLFYDRRDSSIRPTKGYYVRVNNDLAGLGGDVKYLRNQVGGAHYISVADEVVFKTHGQVGHIVGLGKDVRIGDRFMVGGDGLRGFASGGVGPRDASTKDSLGGELMYSGGVELSFPLGLPSEYQISGKLFSDIGSAWEVNPKDANVVDTASLRASVGTGVSWVSPFGVIGIDFGFPVIKEAHDVVENIRVNFGTRF